MEINKTAIALYLFTCSNHFHSVAFQASHFAYRTVPMAYNTHQSLSLRRGGLSNLAVIRSTAGLFLSMQNAGCNPQATGSIVGGVELGQRLDWYLLDHVGLRSVVKLDDLLSELVSLPLGDQLGPDPIVSGASNETN